MTEKPTFKPGDRVRFGDNLWKTVEILDYDWIKRENTYTIKQVFPIHDIENRIGAGHHQHVDIAEDPRSHPKPGSWSGAFFEHAL